MHMERIYLDKQFWLENLISVKQFYTPELPGNFFMAYTQLKVTCTGQSWQSNEGITESTSRYCDEPDDGGLQQPELQIPVVPFQVFRTKIRT